MIGKLYLKIFLSFVLILIVIEILIFALFIFSGRTGFRAMFAQYASAQSMIIKELIEEKINADPEIRIDENEAVRRIILRLGESYKAQVWLESADGVLVFKSFPEDVPSDVIGIYQDHLEDLEDFKLYFKFRKGHVIYVKIPVEIKNNSAGSIHMLFKERIMSPPEGAFGLGLIGIGIVIALLVIPVSRFITKPVKELERSALRIAGGELSHRVKVKGRDEIGELGHAFNRMADQSERMIRGGRELTANISHELRSPLARIRIAEELLREKLKDSSLRSFRRLLNNIRDDIVELDCLIGSILELSKLDIIETPLKIETFNLADLISELLGRLKPAIKRSRIRIITNMCFESSISGDKAAICTALSNILDNGVKFTPENGSITVKISSGHEGLEISVTNTFSELSAEELSMIFEPFYRCEQEGKAGSGLGLAITKRIIEMHGWNIEACNSKDEFKIRICIPAELL
jgi:two-component system sensor histidine kinase CpxA